MDYVDVATAARLSGCTDRAVQKYVKAGKIEAESVENESGGGLAGTAYRIPVDALPVAAQIRYYEEIGHQTMSAMGVTEALDLGAYAKRVGEAGMRQLMETQRAVMRLIGLRACGCEGLTEATEALAAEYGMSGAKLRRLEKRYQAEGLQGLTRRERADKGESRVMCLEARRLISCWDLDCNKLKGNTILDLVLERARELGLDGCQECPYNPSSANHAALMESEDAEFYPACDRAGGGIIPPENRHAVNRVIAGISAEERTYMREGRKPWEAAYMTKAPRVKPDMVNLCWFGDHHQFDVFVLDERGKPVRPWVTAWYDIGSGVMVGWCISLNPNSATITEAFLNAVAEKPNSPVCGAPRVAYMDNGKDYRSRAFEGLDAEEAEYWHNRDRETMDEMYARITGDGVLRLMHVETVHAKAYHGWAKPIERFFRTLEERYCRQIKGYCGGKPADRAENFERTLRTWVERGELMTMDEFAACWQNEILPAYHDHPHSGYGDETPAARYARLPKARSEIFGGAMLAELRKAEARRKMTPMGIKFGGRLYWDEALMHLAKKWLVVKYTPDCLANSLSVYDDEGRYICEARIREAFAMVGEDPEKVGRHVALQKTQEIDVRQRIRGRGVRLPGKRASGNIYTEMTDGMAPGNITHLQAERAQRAQIARKAADAESKWSRTDEYYYRKGLEALGNQK